MKMTVMCSRLLSRNIRNGFSTSIRMYSESDESKGLLELAQDAERNLIFQRSVGKDDPFKLRALKRQASSKAQPNLIPSYYDCRIVGCICEEDSNSIVWMWLFKGEPKKCECGHWFKLTEYTTDLK